MNNNQPWYNSRKYTLIISIIINIMISFCTAGTIILITMGVNNGHFPHPSAVGIILVSAGIALGILTLAMIFTVLFKEYLRLTKKLLD